MVRSLGIISTANIENNFGVLCKHRPVYMLPYGGRYRLIDFSLSNMVNHGIRTVAVYTGEKIRSTMDHLGDGKPWDLNRRINGLYIVPPITQGYTISRYGDIPQFFSTLEFIEQTKEKVILINEPNIIAKVDLDDAMEHFLETDADITLFYKRIHDPLGNYINCEKISISEDGDMINIGLNLGTEIDFNMYLRMGYIKKEVFVKLVKESIEKGDADYIQEAIIKNRHKYKINTYEYDGHVENIRNLKTYYDANMNLLKRSISNAVFQENGVVLTKTKDEPSTIYTDSAQVQNSLIANGCIIEGKVENSIIFRGVRVGKNAIVRNSVVMQKSEILENASVVNSILDKQVIITEGVRIAGTRSIPFVVEKNQIIGRD